MQRPQVHPQDKKASSGRAERCFLVDKSSWAKLDSPQSSAEHRHPALIQGDDGVACVVSHPTLWDGFSLPEPVMSIATPASASFSLWVVLLSLRHVVASLLPPGM